MTWIHYLCAIEVGQTACKDEFKQTTAVRSRISSKFIFASWVGIPYFICQNIKYFIPVASVVYILLWLRSRDLLSFLILPILTFPATADRVVHPSCACYFVFTLFFLFSYFLFWAQNHIPPGICIPDGTAVSIFVHTYVPVPFFAIFIF